MNEEEIKKIMQNLDDDLFNNEIDELIKEIPIDTKSIKNKSMKKLKKEKMKMKKRKLFPVAAASLVLMLGATTIYADDISEFIKSFSNKTNVYDTVVDGEAYFLAEPLKLNDNIEIKEVLFTKDTLNMSISYKLEDDKLPEIKLLANDNTYTPGGYGGLEEALDLSFWDEANQSYNFEPTENVSLIIAGERFDFKLNAGENLISTGEIIEAKENSIDWINLGYEKNEKGIKILTSFDNDDLKLVNIGEMKYENIEESFERLDDGSLLGVATSSVTKDLKAYDEDNKEYILKHDESSASRPIIQFNANLPEDKKVNVNIPSIVLSNSKMTKETFVKLPEVNETKEINETIDLGLQAFTLDTIERISDTKAIVKGKLNVGNDKNVEIREYNFFSENVDKSNTSFNNGELVIEMEFDKDISEAHISASNPYFIVSGNWELEVK